MEKKFIIQIIALALVAFGGIYLTLNYQVLNNFFRNFGANPKAEIQIRGVKIEAEIADTYLARNRGLGGRDSLASNSGMLFIYDKPDIYRFWMKNMKIPLDFIWIREDTVVDLLVNVLPPDPATPDNQLTVYQPKEQVDSVLEVNSGFINTYQIQIGDKIIRKD